MAKRWLTLGFLVLAAVSLWLLNHEYPDIYLQKGVGTFIGWSIIYFIFKIILQDRIQAIANFERRYFLNRTLSIIYYLVTFIVALMVWAQNIQTIVVGAGLVAIGITISLQEVAKNFAGGLNILINKTYEVGDRIEINSKKGDVIDIGIFYTTILEIDEWLSGDQPTGRLSIIPNSFVLSDITNNYTKDFKFLWDEITIPITYASDWRAAMELILDVINKETGTLIKQATDAFPHLERKYFFSRRSTEPAVFIRLTSNWIEMHARFVTEPKQRRIIRSRLSIGILDGIEKSDKIKIASTTIDIVGFPELTVKDGDRETSS
jgi:small-conductance mechanosensitive channel